MAAKNANTQPTRKAPPVFSWQPRPWQQTVIDGQRQTTAIRCSRRAGKTDLCAYTVSSAFLSSPKPLSIAVCSFSLKNAKAVVWARVIELLSPFPPHVKHIKSQDMIQNTNTGSMIRLHGLSAEHGDSIRGFSYDLAVIDEYSLVPYEIFVSAFLPTLTDRSGWLLAISTPRGSFDLMSMLEGECDDPANKNTHARFHFAASQLLGQVPNLTTTFLDKAKKRNPLTYALEYEADISAAASNTVFDQPLLQHALTTDPPQESSSLAVSAGLDFSVRKDKCLVVIRNSRNFTHIIETPYDGDPYAFVRTIQNLVAQHRIRCLAIDRGGCGEVISDMLEDKLAGVWPCEDCRGVIAGERPYHSSNFNLRAELFAMLRDFISHAPNTISTHLDLHQTLLNELSAITRKDNDRGTFQIASRADIIEKIGHSPDVASAASLSLYFERYTAEWSKPGEELTRDDILKMPLEDVVDIYAGYQA